MIRWRAPRGWSERDAGAIHAHLASAGLPVTGVMVAVDAATGAVREIAIEGADDRATDVVGRLAGYQPKPSPDELARADLRAAIGDILNRPPMQRTPAERALLAIVRLLRQID